MPDVMLTNRFDKIPYIANQAIAALLHDTAEGQGGRPRLDDIRARFGEVVVRIVEGWHILIDFRKDRDASWPRFLYAEAGEGMSWPKSEDEDPPNEVARP